MLFLSLSYFQKGSEKQNGIILSNIEALAYGEGGNVNCYLYGSVDCPISSVKVYSVN